MAAQSCKPIPLCQSHMNSSIAWQSLISPTLANLPCVPYINARRIHSVSLTAHDNPTGSESTNGGDDEEGCKKYENKEEASKEGDSREAELKQKRNKKGNHSETRIWRE